MTSPAARAAAVYAVLAASHRLMDCWGQPDRWAAIKGATDENPVTIRDSHTGEELGEAGTAAGRRACAAHVGLYGAAQALALAGANRILRLGLTPRRAALVLVISTATHYYADRHAGHWQDAPRQARGLVRLAHVTGHVSWLRRAPEAGLHLDQAWHEWWLAVAAVAAAVERRRPASSL